MRPLFYEFPDQPNLFNKEDEYMVNPNDYFYPYYSLASMFTSQLSGLYLPGLHQYISDWRSTIGQTCYRSWSSIRSEVQPRYFVLRLRVGQPAPSPAAGPPHPASCGCWSWGRQLSQQLARPGKNREWWGMVWRVGLAQTNHCNSRLFWVWFGDLSINH